MSNTAKYVATGKPKPTGSIHRAPLGTKLPETIEETLDTAFKCLGYVSEDGMDNDNARETEEIKAWGGDTVLTSQTSVSDKFKFKLIEVKNVEVLKTVYGDKNVTGTLEEGITVNATSDEPVTSAWVIDTIISGNAKRIVIPEGKISEIGTISYKDNEPLGYELTMDAMFNNGKSHTEYIK